MPADNPTIRFEALISTELRDLLQLAAELQGRSVSEFVVAAAQNAAKEAIAQIETIHLSASDQASFARALIDPPPLTPAMRRAILNHNKLIRSE